MRLRRLRAPAIETARLTLRLPRHGDYAAWAALRRDSEDFLKPWEPTWAQDHLTRSAFAARVFWAGRAQAQGSALALFLIRRADGALLGAVTLDNIRRGPAQTATLGYWIGAACARQGYMAEAVDAVIGHAFARMDNLLERSGFQCEGVAQAYLQIDGRWRNHVLYARLRADRRGPAAA